jgi:hypothetical protein
MSVSQLAGAHDVTSERRETKYLFPLELVDELVSALGEHLSLHRFSGEGSNSLPGAHHYITTIYFDTPSARHFSEATRGIRSLKVRAREYYDVHPSLAEVATSGEEIVRYQPWLWFELKRREAGHSEKRRFRLLKRDVHAFFAGGGGVAGLDPKREARGESAAELAAIVDYLEGLDEPLAATCLVNYRRVAWQSVDASLRVTLDLGLACYRPRADLFTRERPLERAELGKPASVLDEAVIEVKTRCAQPGWLGAALRRARIAPVEFSKFVHATRCILEHV